MIKKIAILTSGGDAPGMNNVIRSVVKQAQINNIEVFLVFDGYKGLYEGHIRSVQDFDVDNYTSRGGSFIYCSRFPEFKNHETRMLAKKQLDKMQIEALIVVGGDGSYRGAELLHQIGVKTITLPGTIDNDVNFSDFTIGYDTALNSIIENVEKIKDTAKTHNNAMIVEVMGRNCGDLALFSGIATGAHLIITNENKKNLQEISELIKNQTAKGKRGIIVIVSEYILDNIKEAAKTIEEKTGIITKGIVLAHTQRGGSPTSFDRILGTKMGIKAVNLLQSGKSGVALGLIDNKIEVKNISEALMIKRKNHKQLLIQINKLNQS